MNALIIIFVLTYIMYSFLYDLKFILLFFGLSILYTILTQFLMLPTPFTSMRHITTIASWSSPNDPHVYGKLELDISKVEEYIDKLSKKLNKKITITVYSLKLISIVLSKFPDLTCYIKYGKLNEKENIDLCCLVAVGEGEDLCNAVINSCELKSIEQIHDELNDNAEKYRKKKNEDHNKKNVLANFIPNFILALLVQAFSYISSIGLSFKPFGVRSNEFGSCVITSIGSLGIEDGFPPIPPPTFCPLLISICKKFTANKYDIDGNLSEKTFLNFNLTADYRFLNYKTTREFIKEFKRIGENPVIFEEESKKLISKS